MSLIDTMSEGRPSRKSSLLEPGAGRHAVNNAGEKSSRKHKAIIIFFVCCALIAGSVVLTVTLTKKAQASTNSSHLCVWNATNLSYVNGLYTAKGKSRSGYPIYSSPVDESCNITGNNSSNHAELYLFNSMQAIWTISTLQDDTSLSHVQGICPSNSITNVTQCNGQWLIPRDTAQRDVIIFDETCPSMSCKGVQITYDEFLTDEQCIGMFDNRVAHNLYQKGTSDLFLFFNPTLFRWACGSETDMNGCVDLEALSSYAEHQSWYNAHELALNGEKISMPWSNGHRATIECIQTAAPTQPPTTAAPTDAPTQPPTLYPTVSPTDATNTLFGSSSICVLLFVAQVLVFRM